MNHPASTILRPGFVPARRERGFTLVEMLVVLAVAVILAAGAISGWRNVGSSMRLSAAANDFLAHFHLARSEAIKRNARIVICKSANGRDCASTGGWDQGWIIFHDANGNGVPEAVESVLHVGGPLAPGYRMVGNDTMGRYVSFNRFGFTKQVSGAFQAGTITVCRTSLEKTEARQVVISAQGRLRVQKAMLPECA